MTIIWLHLSIKIEDRLLTSGTTGRSDCLPTLLLYYKNSIPQYGKHHCLSHYITHLLEVIDLRTCYQGFR